ncbi:hypothetical protein ACLM5J_07405 [Nocardioides sp. Bht2]|uniref:hypothetical protein n=1 Tax=Nocardioides sp. Bht2 TaxID=3392297 RepID=UPI0039B4BBC5
MRSTLARLSWPHVVVTLLVIALLAVAAERTLAWRDAERRDEASAAALAAAREHALELTGGTVDSAGLAELDDDRAVVIVAASGKAGPKAKKKAGAERYRFRVTLQEKGDRWSVAGVETVP